MKYLITKHHKQIEHIMKYNKIAQNSTSPYKKKHETTHNNITQTQHNKNYRKMK